MFIGIAVFVGGMITIIILKKFFNETAPSTPSYQKVTLKPVKDETVNILSDIRDAIKVEKSETEFYDKGVNVTDQITEVYDEKRHGLQWEEFDLTNNGPDPVYFSVNKWESPEAPLTAGLSLHVDYKNKGLVNRVYLKCATGRTANVSFFVMRKV